jgi:predicted nucleic acid-binding protein
MNVLVDTNVLLSAALRDKLPERVLLYVAARDDFRWLVTPEILAEYRDVLRRPRGRRRSLVVCFIRFGIARR